MDIVLENMVHVDMVPVKMVLMNMVPVHMVPVNMAPINTCMVPVNMNDNRIIKSFLQFFCELFLTYNMGKHVKINVFHWQNNLKLLYELMLSNNNI